MAISRRTPKLDKDLLLFETVKHVHGRTYKEFNKEFTDVQGWLFEIVEEAKKEFSKPEVTLLPKTPAAKRRGRKKKVSRAAKRKLSLASDDDVPPAKQQECSSGTKEESPDSVHRPKRQQTVRVTVPSTPDTITKQQPTATPDTVVRPNQPVVTPPSAASPIIIVATPNPVKQNEAGKELRASKRKLPVQLDDEGAPPAKLECSRHEEADDAVVTVDIQEVRSTRTKTRQQGAESSVRPVNITENKTPTNPSFVDSNADVHETTDVQGAVRSTRTKTRQQTRASPQEPVIAEKQTPTNTSPVDRKEEPHEAMEEVHEVRSTRTRTRQRVLESSQGPAITNENNSPTNTSSVDRNEETVTHEAMEVHEVRSTRTKTRQHALESSPTPVAVNNEHKTPTNSSSADSSSDDEPPQKCPPNKFVRYPPKSFIHDLQTFSSSKPPLNLNPGLTRSFIARNSPLHRPTLKEIQVKRKKDLLEKALANEERLRRQDEEQKRKIEENRKKREERMKRAQEVREQRKQQNQANRQLMEKKMEHHKQMTDKVKELRLREEREKQRLRNQKLEEAEERRKQEEEVRQKRLQEQEIQEKKKRELLEKVRANEERLRRQEEEQKRKIEENRKNQKLEEAEERRKMEEERRQKKLEEAEERRKLEAEERRKLEEERRQRKLQEQEKLKQAALRQKEEQRILTANQSDNQVAKVNPTDLNRTHSMSESTVAQPARPDSYEMTPKKVFAKSTTENYNIFDLNSEDETDEEDDPRKTVPSWAKGSQLTTQLIKNHLHPPDLDALFDPIQPPNLCELFQTQKKRFFKRTSSAHWDTPVLGYKSVHPVLV